MQGYHSRRWRDHSIQMCMVSWSGRMFFTFACDENWLDLTFYSINECVCASVSTNAQIEQGREKKLQNSSQKKKQKGEIKTNYH